MSHLPLPTVEELPEGIDEEDLREMPYEERDTAWLLKYIYALEAHCKLLLTDNIRLYEDNNVLATKCRQHYDKMQEVIHAKLGTKPGEREAWGVTGTGQKFKFTKDGIQRME